MKPKISATVAARQELALSPKARVETLALIEEQAGLVAKKDAIEGRLDKIKTRVDEVFTDEGESTALIEGCDIDGHKLKTVFGVTSGKLDENLVMQYVIELGGTIEELNERCRQPDKPNDPYVRITPSRDLRTSAQKRFNPDNLSGKKRGRKSEGSDD